MIDKVNVCIRVHICIQWPTIALRKIAASIVGVLALGWLILAYEPGTFIPDDSRYAVVPGDFTPDIMASDKKLMDLGGYSIAYVDMGRDEPVILLLPRDVQMVTALMDHLGVLSARFIGHDHGGAIVELLMQHDPERINMARLTNVEAYDQWPSKPEAAGCSVISIQSLW